MIGRMATPTIIVADEVLLGFAANRSRIEELLRQTPSEISTAPQLPESGESRERREAMDRVVEQILEESRAIAIVGLSPNPERASHQVALYLQEQGYRIIPVNPQADQILGEPSYSNLSSIPDQVDVVDIFRRPEYVPDIVEEAIAKGIPAVWMQEGVINEKAAARAQAAGLLVVMDRCMLKEHSRFRQEGKL